ncbi:Methyltransferase domain-containing protein [Tistlia consotensis]|uniref:Methyltransferase domain-containing protein n=1 Tax=Tistlia consotensis USBA 355 TaxID=560819 RepID=A0A1Y6B7A1_9PROT|nr:class I SAM-dependent methyltransferase [Tistlia consotensis]SME96789.1 Methyltransferase domain-containing protein [Tistlia consotensis USBA 355]SNR56151.1 Methyltransferase domain-containing protein [Tistlia consotensis]
MTDGGDGRGGGGAEKARWEERYGSPDYLFGREPNAFLASCRDLLPKRGRALAVADGEARNGVWLARQGLEVVSLDFAPTAQKKAAALAREAGVALEIVEADVHAWDYPPEAFDLVADIFTQFSGPEQRAAKWAGIRRTLKPGGLLILQGYTPKQLEYGTGGPKTLENLYTRALLEAAFGDMKDVAIVEEERELHEGDAHSGKSAVIGLTARK